jgi:hypothetical protein
LKPYFKTGENFTNSAREWLAKFEAEVKLTVDEVTFAQLFSVQSEKTSSI